MRSKTSHSLLSIIHIVLFALILSSCSSHERTAKATALAIEKMNDEHRQYIENRSSKEDLGKRDWMERRELIDGIAARVNNDIILYSEVEKVSMLLLKKSGTRIEEDPVRRREAYREILERLIEIKLIEQRAKELGIVIKDSEIRETVDRIRNQAGMTKEGFIAYLAKEGITYKEYLDQVRRELQKNRLIDIEVRPRIQVSDEICLDYYRKNIEEFTGHGRVRIQQIVILADRRKSKEEELESRKEKILSIRGEIAKGADFWEMARRYSETPDAKDGGDLGYFRRGELLPEIEDVAFSIKPGELSDVIQTDIGFHLIRVIEREEDGPVPFEKVRGKIMQKLMNQELMKRTEAWIKEMKEKAYIDVRL